jgi:DNA-binding beta-propeller fold protein YncE
MDETWLRGVLERALVGEPPIGPVTRNSLQAGIKLRRRRRARGAAGSVAVVAVIAVAIPAVTGAFGSTSPVRRTGVQQAARGPTVYVANGSTDTVTPITTASNTPGKPVKVGNEPWVIAITPDGKTAYVASRK